MDYETNKIISQEELNKMGEELSNYAESLISQQFKKISNDMDYEKKYKEANDKVAARFGTNVAKEIFTDLYESEDERIRKGIISGMKALQEKGKYTCFANIPMDKVFAWLEKQGSEPNWCHHKVDLSNCSEEYRKAYYDGWNNCNQQHSQCKSEWNDVVKCLINGMKFYYEDNEEATWGTEKFSMKVKDILSWLEKQGGEKPADNVESKFKVGDWITDDEDEVIFHITSYDIDYGYQLETVNGTSFHYSDETIEKKYRLWTIQDAKDGDVLCTYECNEPKIVFILKGTPKKHYALGYHCYYNIMYPHFGSNFEKGCLSPNDEDVKPATKEQRDLLFQKMKEEGYEWDDEKKELKKIHVIDEGKAEMDYCFTKMMNGEKVSSAWSEEDEKMCESVIDVLVNNTMSGSEGDKVYSEEIDWLKSLRGRYTWKPSDEQMEALFVLLPTVSYGRNPAFSLYNDLKKLKGE